MILERIRNCLTEKTLLESTGTVRRSTPISNLMRTRMLVATAIVAGTASIAVSHSKDKPVIGDLDVKAEFEQVMQQQEKAQARADKAPAGATVSWSYSSNDQSFNVAGKITPLGARMNDGKECRAFEVTFLPRGTLKPKITERCLDSNGIWQDAVQTNKETQPTSTVRL